jgi:hypothetical protein
MEAIEHEKKKRKMVLGPCNREETMIENVKLNTKEKAQQCLGRLGRRGLYVMSFKYKGTTDGYYVYYVTAK